MHFFVLQKKILQKQSAKIDLRVPGKSCDEIDDDVMEFILYRVTLGQKYEGNLGY